METPQDTETPDIAARFELLGNTRNALFGLKFSPLGYPRPGGELDSVLKCRISWTSALQPIVKDIKRHAQETAHRNPRGSPSVR